MSCDLRRAGIRKHVCGGVSPLLIILRIRESHYFGFFFSRIYLLIYLNVLVLVCICVVLQTNALQFGSEIGSIKNVQFYVGLAYCLAVAYFPEEILCIVCVTLDKHDVRQQIIWLLN